MRLRKGYKVLPFEKVLTILRKGKIYELVRKIFELLKESVDLYIVLEPVVTKVNISNKKYIVVLSIGSMILANNEKYESVGSRLLESIDNMLWSIAEDVWVKASQLYGNKKIYIQGLNNVEIIGAPNSILSKGSTNSIVPFISLTKNPVPLIEAIGLMYCRPVIKLLRPSHIVVNGLKEIISGNEIEIELYKINTNDIVKRPIDILALMENNPFILESLRSKSIFILGKDIGKYSKELEDLIIYNSIIYMLTN